MSKPDLEHHDVIVVDLAMNFQEINRFGGSRGFVAGRNILNWYPWCKVQLSWALSACSHSLACRLRAITNAIRRGASCRK